MELSRSARLVFGTVLAASVTGLIAACGSAGHPAATVTITKIVTVSPHSAAPTITPTIATSPAGPPACATASLKVSLGPGSGALGSSYYPIKFSNASAASCTLYGYPGVSLLTASGTQIGAAAVEDPTYPRQLVTLAPGQAVHAELRVTDARNYPPASCRPVTARQLRIYPPGQVSAAAVAFAGLGCANSAVQILSVQTVQPGAGP